MNRSIVQNSVWNCRCVSNQSRVSSRAQNSFPQMSNILSLANCWAIFAKYFNISKLQTVCTILLVRLLCNYYKLFWPRCYYKLHISNHKKKETIFSNCITFFGFFGMINICKCFVYLKTTPGNKVIFCNKLIYWIVCILSIYFQK